MDFRWLSLHVFSPIKIVTKTARKHHSMVGLMMWNPIDIPCFPIESHRYPHYIYIHIYMCMGVIYNIPLFISYEAEIIISHDSYPSLCSTIIHYQCEISQCYIPQISRRCSHPPFSSHPNCWTWTWTSSADFGTWKPWGSRHEVGTGRNVFFGGKTMGKWMRKLWWLSRLVELYI